jgi:hypothetical protein
VRKKGIGKENGQKNNDNNSSKAINYNHKEKEEEYKLTTKEHSSSYV